MNKMIKQYTEHNIGWKCPKMTLVLTFLQMKKRSEETQTLRAGCSKPEPKKFAPPQTPSRGHRAAKI